MKRFLFATLNLVFRARHGRKFSAIKIGSGSLVALWRLRGRGGNSFHVGNASLVRGHFAFEREGASIAIGSSTYIGGATFSVAESVLIGDHVMVAWGATIFDHGSHSVEFRHRKRDPEMILRGEKDWTFVKVAPIRIDSKAWIGLNAIILSGVHVGEGAVVAAGAVVTKDVPPWTVVAGNPAKPIRTLLRDQPPPVPAAKTNSEIKEPSLITYPKPWLE
jgi:galactoside O-acetyltransferase